ncbi:unnamed protein product, partial [Didymodactylos carnosus]
VHNVSRTSSSPVPSIVVSNYTDKSFGNASYSLKFSLPDQTYLALSHCDTNIMMNNSSTSHRVLIDNQLYTFPDIEQRYFSQRISSGHWWPTTCQPRQRLAIIVSYRNRDIHLKLFLNNLNPFLQQQQLDYTIFVVNQHDDNLFNRARLFNIGYIEAMKLNNYTCFIFHDVDLLPEDDRNVYQCSDQPRHLAVAIDKYTYKLPYSTYFGGAAAFQQRDYVDVNGHSNIFEGWGGEDDDIGLRVLRRLKKDIIRYPMEIARYRMIRDRGHVASTVNPNNVKILQSNYNYDLDGLSTTSYTLNNIRYYKLFTLINVTLAAVNWTQVQTILKIS